MSGTAPQVRAGSTRPAVVAAALVLVLLAPVAFLFQQAYGSVSDRRSATERELEGVAYLRALGNLAFTVADAQTVAVEGRQTDRAALTTAVNQVAAVDERYGASLRTHERWTGVRGAIERAGNAPPATPEAALTAYTEISNLLLALFGKVRDASGLVHDPDADAYHLQEGVASYLPAAVVAAGRLADLARLAPTRPAQQLPATQADLALARVTLLTASGRLVDGLRSAADDTESRTLGANLLSSIDNFQLAAQETITGSGLAGVPASDQSMIPLQRGRMQTAATVLSTAIFNEVDGLLQDRRDDLNRERFVLLGVGVLAVVLIAIAVIVLVLGVRSARIRANLAARASAGPPDDPARPGAPPRWGPTRTETLARREPSGAAR